MTHSHYPTPRETLFRCPPRTGRDITSDMGENETGSEFKSLAIALVKTLAMIGTVCGSVWAGWIVVVDMLREHSNLDPPIAFLFGLIGAAAAGAVSAVFVLSLFRRFGVIGAVYALLLVPLLLVPTWLQAIGAVVAGPFVIWAAVRWVNRRDDPRFANTAAHNSDATPESD